MRNLEAVAEGFGAHIANDTCVVRWIMISAMNRYLAIIGLEQFLWFIQTASMAFISWGVVNTAFWVMECAIKPYFFRIRTGSPP